MTQLLARRGSSPLSPYLDPVAAASYDSTARRLLTDIDEDLPRLSFPPLTNTFFQLGEAVVGAGQSILPPRFDSVANVAFGTWDTTEKAFYARMPNTTDVDGRISFDNTAAGRFLWPMGRYGTVPSFATIQSSVTTVTIEFRARFEVSFSANARWDLFSNAYRGIGASSTQSFATSPVGHWVVIHPKVTVGNVGTLHLRCANGSSTSGTSSASDSAELNAWHDYKIVVTASSVSGYIDGTQIGSTLTTTIPAQPLGLLARGYDASAGNEATGNHIQLHYVKVSWS